MKKIWEKIFGQKRKETKPIDFEWERFQKHAREQFVNLQKKGLSIPIVTL